MVYIHIPFCKSFCTYCDFYSELCGRNEAQQVQKLFVDRLCREIEERRDEIEATLEPRTLYFGGGTPSVLPLEHLNRITETLDGGPYEEFTVEVNPDDIVEKGEDYVRGLLSLGVNRISMGVQSMDDGILKWMNRRHDSASVLESVRILRDSGVENLSLDLIFGLSQLSDSVWEDTIDKVLALAPQHISAYQLSIEPQSALATMVEDGRYVEADEGLCRHQYDILCRRLSDAGYHHYEISNFALPANEAVHNSAYWRRIPYVGLGPGAHSFDGRRRSWNSESILSYSPAHEELTETEAAEETVMLYLRTSRGMPLSQLESISGRGTVSSALTDGSLSIIDSREGPRVRIPESRFFVSDEIIRNLL